MKVTVLVLAAFLSGCVVTEKIFEPEMPAHVEDAKQTAENRPGIDEIPVDGKLPELEPVWVPSWWDEPLGFVFTAMPLTELLPLITKQHSVTFTPEVIEEWEGPTDTAATSIGGETWPRLVEYLPSQIKTRGELIEYLCNHHDYSCEIRPGGGLNVVVNIVKWYHLTAQPGDLSGSMGVDGLGASSGQSSSSMDHSPYENTIAPAIELIMSQPSAAGGSFLLAPEMNTLMVSARPSVHRQIASIVEMLNDRFALSARIQVSIFEIDRDSNMEFGITTGDTAQGLIRYGEKGGQDRSVIDAIVAQATRNDMISFSYSASDAASSFSVAVQALARVSNSKVVFNEVLETRNNVIITSQNLQSRRLLRSITSSRETTQGGLTERRTEIEFEDIDTGWSVSVMPTVSPRGLVTVRLAVARNDLLGEPERLSFGDDTEISLIEQERFNRQMSITLEDGQSHLASLLATTDTGGNAALLSKGRRRNAKEFAVLIRADSVDLHQ